MRRRVLPRVGLIFEVSRSRDLQMRELIRSAIEAASDNELVFLFVTDKNAAIDFVTQIASRDRVKLINAPNDQSALCWSSIDLILAEEPCDYYVFCDMSGKINVSMLSNHCRGERDLHFFHALKPFFFEEQLIGSPSTDLTSRYGDLELFQLLHQGSTALSGKFLRRVKEQNLSDEVFSIPRALEQCSSYTSNKVKVVDRSLDLDWKFYSLKIAHDHFKDTAPSVSSAILESLLRPGFLSKVCRGTKWAVSARAYLNHFASLLVDGWIDMNSHALLPYQGQLYEAILENDAKQLVEMLDRLSKNKFSRTRLRDKDFSENGDLSASPESSIARPDKSGAPAWSISAASAPLIQRFRGVGSNYRSPAEKATYPENPKPAPLKALNFSLCAPGGYGAPGHGWAFIMQDLLTRFRHSDYALGFDGFVEKSFVWNFGNFASGRDTPWIGVSHRPPDIPEFYDRKSRFQFYETPYFHLASNTNIGMITVSKDHAAHLERVLGKPVVSVMHPTNHDVDKWHPVVLDNDRFDVVQIGSWLRKLHSIFLLPDGPYSKRILVGTKQKLLTDHRFNGERNELLARGMVNDIDYDSVDFIEFLSPKAYDALLSRSVVFLDMFASTANNTILECIARHTPIVVRKLPSTVEYLGKRYPLFFETLTEAAEHLHSKDLILSAHKYLKERAKLADLHLDGFYENIRQAVIKFEAQS